MGDRVQGGAPCRPPLLQPPPPPLMVARRMHRRTSGCPRPLTAPSTDSGNTRRNTRPPGMHASMHTPGGRGAGRGAGARVQGAQREVGGDLHNCACSARVCMYAPGVTWRGVAWCSVVWSSVALRCVVAIIQKPGRPSRPSECTW